MKYSYGAVITDFCYRLGRFDRKWGRCGLGPFFFIQAVLTDKPETANVKTRDFLEQIILSFFNGYCVSNAVDFSKKKMFYKRFCQLSH